MKHPYLILFITCLSLGALKVEAQLLSVPDGGVNQKSWAGHRVGVTDVEIHWNAPGVKGREGKIWGTPVAHYGFDYLGFGPTKASPWRAGANECTRMSFSTDVMIEGKPLPAGSYGFFIALGADSCTLIFSKNDAGWGTYFYKQEEDVLRVTVHQQKDLPQSREWLTYTFSQPTKNSVQVALEWERWRIPFTVTVDYENTALASIRKQLTGGMGFDPQSLQSAGQWCALNDVNHEEALEWINGSLNPLIGGRPTFGALSTKADLQRKLGRSAEADQTMNEAVKIATTMELHGYGRQLIGQKKYDEALAVFQQNFEKNQGAWPTHIGLARGYSAAGNLSKALEHAKIALEQAPDDLNRKSVQSMIEALSAGKAIPQ